MPPMPRILKTYGRILVEVAARMLGKTSVPKREDTAGFENISTETAALSDNPCQQSIAKKTELCHRHSEQARSEDFLNFASSIRFIWYFQKYRNCQGEGKAAGIFLGFGRSRLQLSLEFLQLSVQDQDQDRERRITRRAHILRSYKGRETCLGK